MKDLPKQFQVFFILITCSATTLWIMTLVNIQWDLNVVKNMLIFGILAVIAESLPVPMPKGGFVTVSFPIFFASVLMFPPGITLTIALAGGLFVFGKNYAGQPFYKRVFNASQYVLSIASAKAVLEIVGVNNFQWNIATIAVDLLAAFSYVIINVTMLSVALSLVQGKKPFNIWKNNIRWSMPNFLAMSPLGLLVALVYYYFGILGILFLFIPLLASRHSFQLYIDMRQNYLSTVEALVLALEAKDSYTSGHSERVSQLAVAIAEVLKIPEERIEFIRYAGVLHDVGKIGVAEGILNKKGKLLEGEWEAIRDHPVIGQKIIKNIKFLFDIGHVVRHHHERFDGNGYPDGLKGEEIPLEARIIAVADTYDAMTSDRSYRRGKKHDEALEELHRVAGTQLDPYLVDAFMVVLDQVQTAAETGMSEKNRSNLGSGTSLQIIREATADSYAH